jgi:hypothetical protein
MCVFFRYALLTFIYKTQRGVFFVDCLHNRENCSLSIARDIRYPHLHIFIIGTKLAYVYLLGKRERNNIPPDFLLYVDRMP